MTSGDLREPWCVDSPTVALIGECMVEIRPVSPELAEVSYGGDVLNTAVYLKRSATERSIDVRFVTVVGDDALSDDLVAAWEKEGIDTSYVKRRPSGKPGLYIVHTDEAGERSFTYYRSDSAARELFREEAQGFADVDLIFLSGITLSILDSGSFELLLAALEKEHARGALVAFDTNYRPAAWQDATVARERISRTLAHTDIALPTFSDEALLFGDPDPGATVRRLRSSGVSEVVVKLSAEGCLVSVDDSPPTRVPGLHIASVIDTTGAGDAFNGAYLAARLGGQDPAAAAERGNLWGAHVVQFRGAIAPFDERPAVFA